MKLKQNYAPFPLGLKSPLHLQAPGVCKEHAGQSLGTCPYSGGRAPSRAGMLPCS